MRVKGDLLDLGGTNPGDRGLPGRDLAAPDPERRRLRRETRSGQRDVHVGDHMLCRLERGDRPAELLAHLGVGDGSVDHRLTDADEIQTVQRHKRIGCPSQLFRVDGGGSSIKTSSKRDREAPESRP